MPETEPMEMRAKELRRRLAELPAGRTGKRRYPEDVRAAVVKHVRERKREGVSEAEACKELGIHAATVHGWGRGRGAVRAVEVEPEAPGGAVTVVLPSGVRIEGLSLAALIAVVKGLS